MRTFLPPESRSVPAWLIVLCGGVLTVGLYASPGYAQQPLRLDDGQDAYTLGGHFSILADEQRDWSITDVTSPVVAPRFEPVQGRAPAFGYSEAAYWLRFSLHRAEEGQDTWFLSITNKSLDDVTLYTPDEQGGFTVRRTGDAFPFHTREIKDRNFVFELPVVDAPRTYYLRIASKGPMYFPMKILSVDAYVQRSRMSQLMLGLFLGMLVVMVLYHLLLYASIRDPSYLYYVMFIAYITLYQASLERIGFEFFWPENLWWAERANSVLALLCGITGLQFSRSFLQSWRYAPRWDRALVVLMVLCVPLISLNLIGMQAGVSLLTAVFFIVIAFSIIATGVKCLLRGDQAARSFLIAWSFLLAGLILTVLGYLNVISPTSFVGARSLQIGVVLEIILFALGLGHRYKLMRLERERMRHRIASDLHDDIGSGLTQISLFSELMKRNPDPAVADLADQIGTQSRTLAATMRDIVWAIEPRQDSWDDLELRMKDYAAGLLAPACIAFNMQGERRHAHRVLPVEVRQNVLMLFKEAVHNSVKHSRCTEIAVRWRLEKRSLWLQVQDNGCGFDPETVRRGSGLHNLRRRSEDLHGTFSLRAAPGQPTTIEVEVPL